MQATAQPVNNMQMQQGQTQPYPQPVYVQQQSSGWKCTACQQQNGYVDETSCCGVPFLLWWCCVPFGLCIYPCCCKGAHKKTRKCLGCENKQVISDARCCE